MLFTKVVHMALFIKNSYTSRWWFFFYLGEKTLCDESVCEAICYNRMCSINIQPSITCVCKSTLSHITVKVNILQPLQLLCKLLMKSLRHILFTSFSGKFKECLHPHSFVGMQLWKYKRKTSRKCETVEVSCRFSFHRGRNFPQKIVLKCFVCIATCFYWTKHQITFAFKVRG